MALLHRRVDLISGCPICHHEPETDFHALVSCPFVRSVWSLTSIGSYIGSVNSFREWWNNLAATCSSIDIEQGAVVLWSIWNNRNDVVWNGKHKPAALIFQSAMDMHSQWIQAQPRDDHHHTLARQHVSTSWSKPPNQFLKCNVDAAVFNDPPRLDYGCLLRDYQGSVIAAIHGSLPGAHNPTTAEALSIREALSWFKDLNVSHVIVESDAFVVVEALKTTNLDNSSFGLIVEDCRFLSLELLSCSFAFVRRSANQAAHMLARATGSLSGCEGRVIPISSVISRVILFDI